MGFVFIFRSVITHYLLIGDRFYTNQKGFWKKTFLRRIVASKNSSTRLITHQYPNFLIISSEELNTYFTDTRGYARSIL